MNSSRCCFDISAIWQLVAINRSCRHRPEVTTLTTERVFQQRWLTDPYGERGLCAGNPLASPFVLATLTGNGLEQPITAAFDGERILVTNRFANRISLWKAADLTPLGFVSTGNGTQPTGAGSDGLNFWITLQGTNKLARF
jgi:hypothetical protein